jgi:hypothetical protein
MIDPIFEDQHEIDFLFGAREDCGMKPWMVNSPFGGLID